MGSSSFVVQDRVVFVVLVYYVLWRLLAMEEDDPDSVGGVVVSAGMKRKIQVCSTGTPVVFSESEFLSLIERAFLVEVVVEVRGCFRILCDKGFSLLIHCRTEDSRD